MDLLTIAFLGFTEVAKLANGIVCMASTESWAPRWTSNTHLVHGYATILFWESRQFGMDPWIVAAIIQRESSWIPGKEGELGEVGLLQTFPHVCEMPRDKLKTSIAAEIRCGVRHLSRFKKRCGDDPYQYLGAYNSGRCGWRRSYAERVMETMRQGKRCAEAKEKNVPKNAGPAKRRTVR